MKTSRTRLLVLVGLLLGLFGVGIVLALTGGAPVSDGVTLNAPGDGPTATIEGSTEVDLENAFPASDTINFTTDAGNIEFVSSGDAAGTVHKDEITGTYTTVTSIDAVSNQLTINPGDKQDITVGGGVTKIQWRDNADIDDGTIDFVYSASSDGIVIIQTNQANTDVIAYDDQNNEIRDTATTDGSGVATFDSLDAATDSNIKIQSGSGNAPQLSNLDDDGTSRTLDQELFVDVDDADFDADTVTLEWYVDGSKEATTTADTAGTYSTTITSLDTGTHDYYVVATDKFGLSTTSQTKSFEIDPFDPVVSDVQPEGDLDAKPTEISAQVNDSDFTGAGDSVDVEISLDGAVIHTETIGSNQEVNTSMPSDGQLGGEHTITVEATDSYGQTDSQSVTYRVPNQITIRAETNYSTKLAANGEVRFYPGGSREGSEVYSRTTTDGTLDMTGLPVSETFIVEVEPSDTNFTQRTVFIESIYEQENIYLLNTTLYDTVESRFILNDPTGRFDSESVLKIQKPIDINGTLTYQTIVGDRFGTEGVTATLQQDSRYQLRVSALEFEQAVGPYRAATGETVEVRPGTSSINLSDSGTWAADAAISNTTIEYRFNDPTLDTDKLTVYIHERNNKSNQPVANQTFTDIGEISGQATVPVNQSDREWVVEFVVQRNNEEFVKTVRLSNRKILTPPLSSAWKGVVGVGLLVLLAGAFSVLNAAVGAVIVSLFGGLLYFIGFLGGATSGIAVALAIFISVVGHIMSSTR